ncbi:MAG TPA: sensor histidine kinase [Syntrophorhabdales bacterium]|nr:sensor histidine kinase [Syntrophorhabdales bacterium]
MDEKDYLYDLLVHDLVGPLAVVATTVSSLLGKPERYGDLNRLQRECLERIKRNTQKARGLVQDIMEVARAEESVFKCELFTMPELIREALIEGLEFVNPALGDELSRAQSDSDADKILERNGISLSISDSHARASFCHDRRKVLHIVRNLVSNALKYRKEKMDLSVSGENDLVVSVSNDGPVISEGERQALFKRFSRLERNQMKDTPGAGLGLFCVKALVEHMQGQISVSSGRGFNICFTVRIPAMELINQKEDVS